MERLEAFENMLSDIREQSDYETAQMGIKNMDLLSGRELLMGG